jgi:hypothetical protein
MIGDEQRAALLALRRVNSALHADNVWSPAPYHIADLHRDVEQSVLTGIHAAVMSADESPLGIVIQGQKGAGKTHLLGWVRRRVQCQGGYFFLVSLMQGVQFAESAALAVAQGLNRDHEQGTSQIVVFLRQLAERTGVPERVARAVTGETPVSPADLTSFVQAVVRLDRGAGLDTLRALVLCASPDLAHTQTGQDYLSSLPEFEPGDRARWGIRPAVRQPAVIVQETSRLLALTGPTVVAIDQIDALVEKSTKLGEFRDHAVADEDLAFAGVGQGLMDLRDWTRRTLTIVSCLPHSWSMIKSVAADTVEDRFRDVKTLDQMHDPALARDLVEKRFATVYRETGFAPPHALWPVSPSAFDAPLDCTPRWLLKRIDRHVAACLRDDVVRELDRLHEDDDVFVDNVTPTWSPSTVDLAPLDALFAELRQKADIRPALDPSQEDEEMPGLLYAGLAAWIIERGDTGELWRQDEPRNLRPALHARLVRTVDEELEVEEHWAFRAIGHADPRAALNRMRRARTAANTKGGVPGRELILLRNAGWSGGEKTQEELTELRENGGHDLPITEDDLRTFGALKELLDRDEAGLAEWLAAQRPATKSELFGAVLPTAEPADPAWPTEEDNPDRATAPTLVVLGDSMSDGSPVTVELEALRKHVVIFAGTGSGKTVFIRRLIEECALLGVSAIVLDPNNDLARLGDPWPDPPAAWGPDDAVKALEYRDNVEVVVWTPGHSARPLSFPALPDFAAVRDNADDFRKAVDVAVDALAPRAKVNGATGKAERSRAVLREALLSYGQRGERSVTGLIRMLADLPGGVSGMGNAERLAADMAETLRAAQVNDPLFGDGVGSVDPGVLLTPRAGARARISVISFIGLASESQKQAFVSQLEMELFAWLRAHPAGERPLGGLLVIDEAQTIAPAGATTPSTQTTVLLAGQARKFGLGLVLATQAPKGLHNQIPGNAGSMVVGRIGVPAQIGAVEEMARARGSEVSNVGRLGQGQFYLSVDGSAFHKASTPLCLTYHPKSPLTPDEVIRRARDQEGS